VSRTVRCEREDRSVPGSRASRRSYALSERLDALASALRDAGVSPERASRLLASAAAATLDAVALEHLLADGEPQAPAPREQVAATAPRERRPVRLAA
jgi:hypothetical protein